MTTLLILPRLKVENANAISGFTYGFPAITHFLGFTHALSRAVTKQFGITLDRCGVIVHDHHLKTQQPKGWGDSVFCLTRNPLTKEGKTAPFIEEGKMHLEVSLLIESEGYLSDDAALDLEDMLMDKLPAFRLAGGTITHYQPPKLQKAPSDEKSTRKLLFSLLPGFALMDRSELLAEHFKQLVADNPNTDVLDAWLDFCALKYKAVPQLKEGETPNEETKANWDRLPKPAPGYLVPIMTGYKGISRLYEPGEVANTRDSETPFRFVESIFGIGEWISPHKLKEINPLFWRYTTQDDCYICTQQ